MGLIVIGYHYTSENNLKTILKYGLHPRDLSEIAPCFVEHLNVKNKCIWVFTTQKSDEELLFVLLDVLTRHEDFKIICLKVRYSKTNSVRCRFFTKEQKIFASENFLHIFFNISVRFFNAVSGHLVCCISYLHVSKYIKAIKAIANGTSVFSDSNRFNIPANILHISVIYPLLHNVSINNIKRFVSEYCLKH